MRVLLIANQTLGSRAVFDRVVWLEQQHPGIHVHVVVPATPSDQAPSVSHDDSGRRIFDYLAIDLANARLNAALSSIGKLGVSVSGEVGPPDPVTAIKSALERNLYGHIILATLGTGTSRWLRMDVPHRAARLTNIPIDHVVGDVEPPTAGAATLTWRDLDLDDTKERLEILIVDDSDADLELTRVALERAPVDCDVRVARNGEQGIEMATGQQPDLVLLDLSMPGMSGLETLEKFSTVPSLQDVPVVILTTSNRPEDRDRAHSLGAAAYIVKENDFDRFEAVLVGLLAEVALP